MRRFNVGQVVTCIPDRFLRHAAPGNYKIIAAMPDRDGDHTTSESVRALLGKAPLRLWFSGKAQLAGLCWAAEALYAPLGLERARNPFFGSRNRQLASNSISVQHAIIE
jgi:hypothetical protein